MPIAKNPNGARTDAERRAHNKWEQANRATLGVRVGKADGEAFRAWCSERGQRGAVGIRRGLPAGRRGRRRGSCG